MISITIDGKKCSIKEGVSVIEAARANGIDIPILEYDPRVIPPRDIETAFVEIAEQGRTRFAPAISTPLRDGMDIRTKSDDLDHYRRIYLQSQLGAHHGDCVAPCALSCPARIDIQKYLYHAADGNFSEALRIIKESNPLPTVCGRVCPHPCESECRRNALDGAVNINEVKRFVASWDKAQVSPFTPKCLPDTGFRIAVIGAGPAGLTAAWFLRRLGHRVSIFEMQEAAGGMLRWGIPCYRLPEKELKTDVQSILDLGVEIHYNHKLGRDFTLESLKREGFDAIFVGLGAQKSTPIGVKGEALPGVMSGLDLLAKLARMERPDLGNRVLVIGGGNTAIDAARSAVRLGVKDVTIVYRRSRVEMPAQDTEIEEAIEEGIQIQFLTAPSSISREGGVLHLNCTRMALGEPDKSGRRRPVPVPGSEFTLKADSIVSAVGQGVDGGCLGDDDRLVEKRGNIKANPVTLQTDLPWVFAGGDCVTGPDIAVAAIGAGQRAASMIDQYLEKGCIEAAAERYTCTKGSWRELPVDAFTGVHPAERREVAARPPEIRRNDFAESTALWDAEAAMEEAVRCLSCGCYERYACDLRPSNPECVRPMATGVQASSLTGSVGSHDGITGG
jgi:formate dehydrogenase major subunit